MADLANATMADGTTARHQASAMSHADFEALRGLEHSGQAQLRCVNPECVGDLYLRRTERNTQLFAHKPGTLDSCPERRGEGGESESHLRMKDHMADVAERTLGLRVELEYRIAGLRTDIAAFLPDMLSTNGPVLCIEVQNSPLPIDELDRRDNALRSELERFAREVPQAGHRAVPWIINHTPAWAPERAHFQVDRDDYGSVVSGLYEWGRPDGDAMAVTTTAALQAIRDGSVARLTDLSIVGTASSYWATRPGAVPGRRVPARRPRSRSQPEGVGAACTRVGEDRTPGRHRPAFGRGSIGVTKSFCPECLDHDATIRMVIDPGGWIYCGSCGWEPGRRHQ